MVHVLTGPDHLSALATLSVNTDSKQSFWYGIRWGIGHSTGLVVVGTIFILLSENGNDDSDDRIPIPEPMETLAECLVGIFMILLGSYHLYTVLQKRSIQRLLTNNINLSLSTTMHFNLESDHEEMITKSPIHDHLNLKPGSLPLSMDANSVQYANNEEHYSDDYQHRPLNIDERFHLTDNSTKKQLIAICIGLIHGVAGPGGVLGVIPAIQLHNLFLSVIYLGTFCCCSTLTMGLYAASYGYLSSRISGYNMVNSFRIELFSASLSIFIGALWLLLLVLGKLQDIFP